MSVTSKFGAPELSPGFLLWHALLRWQRSTNAALEPLGLTHMQFVLLTSTWWLVEQEHTSPNQTELADWVGIDKMTTSQALRTLEAKELVARDADPRDARAFRLKPTRKGAKLAARAIGVVEDVDSEFFAAASSPKDTVRLLSELARAEELFAHRD